MDVEHLWFSSKPLDGCNGRLVSSSSRTNPPVEQASMPSNGVDMVQTLTVMADKRLYKLVKWCKSLPLFKSILVSECQYRYRDDTSYVWFEYIGF